MSNNEKLGKIQVHFQKLSSAALLLNKSSDELSKNVGVLDAALAKLNVGLSVWVSFSHWKEEYAYSSEQIGYAKINNRWGIGIRTISGDERFPEEPDEEGPWLFAESPRELRLRAVNHLGALIEELGERALAVNEKIKARNNEVQELASAIAEIATDQKKGEGIVKGAK
jgi:hypothetical protein